MGWQRHHAGEAAGRKYPAEDSILGPNVSTHASVKAARRALMMTAASVRLNLSDLEYLTSTVASLCDQPTQTSDTAPRQSTLIDPGPRSKA